MELQETTTFYKSDALLLSDSNYYKYIFKKTEKIVCTVFYILEHSDKDHTNVLYMSVLGSAKRTLDSVLQTLSCRWYTTGTELYTFLSALVALESNIRVAQAVGLFQEEVADLLSLEINTVLRALRQYVSYEKISAPDVASFSGRTGGVSTVATTQEYVGRRDKGVSGGRSAVSPARVIPKATPATFSQGQSKGQKDERRSLIKDILSSNGQLTIKDISTKVPNLSEKTIQREITAMVSEGAIVKEGERRWSRYSLRFGV